MNEAETRAELIDPKIKDDGWDSTKDPDIKVHREYPITAGRIRSSGGREKALKADYLLTYKTRKLAVIEAKSNEHPVSEGVGQAKDYAGRLQVDHTYAANGNEIYYINMKVGAEGSVDKFHSPQDLYIGNIPNLNDWQKKFDDIPFEDKCGSMAGRFYQEIAVERVLDAIARRQKRILLTLATGTGKTFIAFQIAWKLFHSRWNIEYDGKRQPKILFLADRNILANQAFNIFSSFPETALIRIKPGEIKKKGKVPTNGSVFFTIFQTFMCGPEETPYFGEYPKDFFDLIIIDECHRGGANDESSWRAILEYFSPAVQLGLTATPKRDVNANTYLYFGRPVYTYSLKSGINDGYLTPFKVKNIKTSLDEYQYDPDDEILEGDVVEGKVYTEGDFNKIIEIKAREAKRVSLLMDLINQHEKTLVFCRTQAHAAAVRDLINQRKNNSDPLYCVRVTANDGELGEQYLRDFQDNEKTIPTILTTSQKLSTGVDARNVRNIVLMRPVNNMVEFKQIIGRGTRLFDGKNYFTIVDFVNATEKFKDDEWDGPEESEPCPDCKQIPCVCGPVIKNPCPVCGKKPCICEKEPPEFCSKCQRCPCICRKMVKVILAKGKELTIDSNISTLYFDANGNKLTALEFLEMIYGKLPQFFKSEEELRFIWAMPDTRKSLLDKLDESGIGLDCLTDLQKLINAENSDIFDVLQYLAYSIAPVTRAQRVSHAQNKIFTPLRDEQKEFLDFVLSKYIETGITELEQDKLPNLLELKYRTINDAEQKLGDVENITSLFIDFQKYLYV